MELLSFSDELKKRQEKKPLTGAVVSSNDISDKFKIEPIKAEEMSPIKSSVEEIDNSQFKDQLSNAGIGALKELPNIVSSLSNDTSKLSSIADVKKANASNTLSLASSGAQIGSAFGPWGAAAGALLGAGAGILKSGGSQDKFYDRIDQETVKKLEEEKKLREIEFFNNNSSEKIEDTIKLIQKNQGLMY